MKEKEAILNPRIAMEVTSVEYEAIFLFFTKPMMLKTVRPTRRIAKTIWAYTGKIEVNPVERPSSDEASRIRQPISRIIAALTAKPKP